MSYKLPRYFIYLCSLVCANACAGSNALETQGSQGWPHGSMAATANPHATDAAIAMLEKGGHAVDAAIAAHLVLGLVEPQSSGIGGGGFMLVYSRDDRSLVFHDGRETAPAGARADMFMSDGEVMNFLQAWQSGKAIGTPGAVALYKQAHDAHGRLPWVDLFQPAIVLARNGFEVSPRLAAFLPRLKDVSRLDENPGSKEYFYPEGEPLQVGYLRKNPAYAATLTRIAGEGPSAFYEGPIAQQIAQVAQAEPDPGTLTPADMAGYEAKLRPVVCGDFAEQQICTTSLPSSGAAQIMIAQLYEQLRSETSSHIFAYVDAQRLAYADRDHYFGDPDFIEVPLQQLLDPRYIELRAQDRFAPNELPLHGDPRLRLGQRATEQYGIDTTIEASGTTHLSIVDKEGNAVSFTATVEAPFGSGRWVEGFLLNNEMTDFAREVPDEGPHPANVIQPGKRPRSSMSPTMILDGDGELLMVTGSPGGNSIPAYVSKSILGVMAWDLTPEAAIGFPNIIARGQKVRVEIGVEQGPEIASDLKAEGYQVQEREGENSGIHLILVTDNGLVGAADKRREGTVRTTK
ncbi:MAG: gamma-glutamyltransferase [Pseudomonadales bacterium]|nr:gamma-glutamyltransferase [Pseudomonadales bacterium]